MVKQKGPKKHHFVPQSYLKQFMQGTCFYTLDIEKLRKGFRVMPRQSNSAKICYQEEFYAIGEGLHGGDFGLERVERLHLEANVFHTLENRYPTLLSRLTTDAEISDADIFDLCDFMLQLKLRNPYWLKQTIEKNKDQWIDDSLDKIVEKAKAHPRFQRIPADVRQFLIDELRDKNKRNPNFAKQLHLSSLIERYTEGSTRNEKFRTILANSSWSMLKSPENGPHFITSDNPGVTVKPDGLYYNTNFSEGFVFYFPLSFRYCLVISEPVRGLLIATTGHKRISTEYALPQTVIRINDSLIQVINKLIVGSDDLYLSRILAINTPKSEITQRLGE